MLKKNFFYKHEGNIVGTRSESDDERQEQTN